MRRRTSIHKISTFLGTATYFPALAGMLEGCAKKKETPLWVPIEITDQQRSLISSLADEIIPATDTPGATDAGVPAFIELLLQDVFERQDARDLLRDLEQFNTHCKSETGVTFLDGTSAQKQVWMEKAANAAHKQHAFFLKMRSLVVGAYFTSEVGVKENLHYLPIPGKYEACRKIDELDKVIVGDRL